GSSSLSASSSSSSSSGSNWNASLSSPVPVLPSPTPRPPPLPSLSSLEWRAIHSVPNIHRVPWSEGETGSWLQCQPIKEASPMPQAMDTLRTMLIELANQHNVTTEPLSKPNPPQADWQRSTDMAVREVLNRSEERRVGK